MSLPSPNLDDRTYDDLVADALREMKRACPSWNDQSAGDPGRILLEAFAYLTDVMIYRLNRIPEKAYVEFLRLIGVQLQAPTAATARLVFSRSGGKTDRRIEIPLGTRVTVARASGDRPAPIFTTADEAAIEPGAASVEVVAHHCELVRGELLGIATGEPGLTFEVTRPPIVAPTGSDFDLTVAVEMDPQEADDERVPAIRYGEKLFRIWREREEGHFAELGDERHVFVAHRVDGRIVFAPAVDRVDGHDGGEAARPVALAEVPKSGREIRVWYRCGGGVDGNVAEGTLTALKDQIPGVKVTNVDRGTGGRAPESLENALVRGPQELRSLERAVTADDYELLAKRLSGEVARAKAYAESDVWRHGRLGAVKVLIVPTIGDDDAARRVSVEDVEGVKKESTLQAVARDLDRRSPLGTVCSVDWARYKKVSVRARVVAHREADRRAVEERVLERLHAAINPFPSEGYQGWRFGTPLHVSRIYDLVLSDARVLRVEEISLHVDEAPSEDVSCIVADEFQSRTWFAGSGPILFRSMNDGEGWEPAGRFADEEVAHVAVHPEEAGIVAVATERKGERSAVYVSENCGESWDRVSQLGHRVNDLAWTSRGSLPRLLLATSKGLQEIVFEDDWRRGPVTPRPVIALPSDPDLGMWAVRVWRDAKGTDWIAVAAENLGGVHLSENGGESFEYFGLRGKNIHSLLVQPVGGRAFLWAAAFAKSGADKGEGCFRREIRSIAASDEKFELVGRDWNAGSCYELAIVDDGKRVLAGTFRGGIAELDLGVDGAAWTTPHVSCGLPLRDSGRFFPVRALAVDPTGRVALGGGEEGIRRRVIELSRAGESAERTDEPTDEPPYENCSGRSFSQRVAVPPTWLFCSGEHRIDVVSDDEETARED